MCLGVELLFLGGESGHILLQIFLFDLALAIVFVLVNVAGLGATDASFQPEAFHRLGIGVLKPDKVLAGHDVVGAKPGAVLGFGAVAFLGFRLTRFLLSLGGDYRHDRDMKVRRLLVHVEMCADNIFLLRMFVLPSGHLTPPSR